MGPSASPQQIRELQRRKEQLEEHLRRCHAAEQQRRAPNPSLGREVDDTRSVLAKVRAELAQLAPR